MFVVFATGTQLVDNPYFSNLALKLLSLPFVETMFKKARMFVQQRIEAAEEWFAKQKETFFLKDLEIISVYPRIYLLYLAIVVFYCTYSIFVYLCLGL